MDPDKAAFLAGVDELELDEYDAVVMARGALREMLVEQISDDEPPQVWQTARRLLDGGMERLDVLRQLVLALDSTMMTAMGRGVDLDRDGYVDVLDRLPVPAAERVEQVIVDIVCDRQPIDAEELDRLVGERLGMPERTVCEVLDVEAGRGLTVRDLRTGDRTVVRERTFSRDARVGELVCARVVSDGESHQFIGALFRVAPGTENRLLELLEERDGYGLLHLVAQQHRPPMLVTGDGDPLRECRAELAVGDPAAARAELDRRYEAEGDGWIWFAAPDTGGGRTALAWLQLADGVLTVRTVSEPRLDTALTELRAALPGAQVTRDERNPFDLGNAHPPSTAADAVPQEVFLELADRLERNWCNERVPALDGHTPREAAADPTRRDELARLIASFPEIDPASGMIGLRPARLRELLGLAVTTS